MSENKLTVQDILEVVKTEEYKVFSGRLTVCVLTLRNGFLVTGESSCVDESNFEQLVGESIARQNAISKIWLLEGYLKREMMWACSDKENEFGELRQTPVER